MAKQRIQETSDAETELAECREQRRHIAECQATVDSCKEALKEAKEEWEAAVARLLMNCAHSPDSWCLDCVRKEHYELTQRAEDAENEATMLAGAITSLIATAKEAREVAAALFRVFTCDQIDVLLLELASLGIAPGFGFRLQEAIETAERIVVKP